MNSTAPRIDFNELSDLSERLKTNTDQLNLQLKAIEDRLNALALGVEAWVTKQPLQQEFSRDGAILASNALLHGAVLNPQVTLHGNQVPRRSRTRTALELGYAKFSDGWHLAVRTVNYTQTKCVPMQPDWDEPTDPIDGVEVYRDAKPLLRASRTVRTLAVDRIPDLLEAIYDAAIAVTTAVEKARTISDSLR